MAIYSDGQIVATMHDFKTNISKYVKMLERGEYRAVLVRRYSTTIGVFQTVNSLKRYEARVKLERELAADGCE